ncbi:MAG TPA: invasin domain 3-containing protein, partial [Candidatus Deferrimicrobiaceae bacterium]
SRFGQGTVDWPFVSLGRNVAVGETVRIALTWGSPGDDAIYLDGKRLNAVTHGSVNLPAFITRSSRLILGAEPASTSQKRNGVFHMAVSPITSFRVFDTVVPKGTETEKPVIASVVDDSFKIPGIGGKIVAGETVTATLVAQPGGQARFDMGRVKDIPMAELAADTGGPGKAPVAPGTYRGSYTVKPGDDFVDGRIVGQFVSADNVSALPTISASKWTIETKPVVTFSIANKDLPADKGSKSRIKLTAKDANGNPLKGRNLKLTLSTTDEYTGTIGAGDFGKQVGASVETRWKGTTDAWGEVEFDYVAGFAAKTVILQAKDLDSGGVSVDYITAYKEASIDIALTAPRSLAASRRGLQYMIKVEASRTQLTADGRSRSVIRAAVSDPNGRAVPGDTVTFALSSENGTLRTIAGVTDSSGVATAEYIAGRKIGIVVISATDTIRNVSGNVSILLLADAPAKIILKARPESLPADGNSRADIQVKVTDINDNPNRDTKVEFKIKQGAGRLDYDERTTDTFGDALDRFQAGTTPGIATILATVRSKVPSAAELLKAKNVIFVPWNESGESVRVEKWLKKKGDTVLLGEPIVAYTVGRSSEVKTIDAPYDLTIGETLVEYWDSAEVGQTLATVVPTVK